MKNCVLISFRLFNFSYFKQLHFLLSSRSSMDTKYGSSRLIRVLSEGFIPLHSFFSGAGNGFDLRDGADSGHRGVFHFEDHSVVVGFFSGGCHNRESIGGEL